MNDLTGPGADIAFATRQVAPDGSPLVDGRATSEASLREQRLREAHEKVITAIEGYTAVILTSTHIPVSRRGALVARLGKLTVSAAGVAPLPGVAAAALRPPFGGLAVYGDGDYEEPLEGYPLANPPGDLGAMQRQTIAALQEMQKPKEVDRARTLEALITSREQLAIDTSPGARRLVAKLDAKIERLIDELAPEPVPASFNADLRATGRTDTHVETLTAGD